MAPGAPCPAGYVVLDAALARALTPGEILVTPHPSAGAEPTSPLRWSLATVRVEGVRELGALEDGRPVVLVDVSRQVGEGRVVLAYQPEDLLRVTPRRGTVGS